MSRLSILLCAALVGCSSLPRYNVEALGEGVDTDRLRSLHAQYQRPILVLDGRLYVPDARCCGEAGPSAVPVAVERPSHAPPPGAVGLELDEELDEPVVEPELGDLRCVLAEDGSHFDLEGALDPEQELYYWDGERLRRAQGFGVPLP